MQSLHSSPFQLMLKIAFTACCFSKVSTAAVLPPSSGSQSSTYTICHQNSVFDIKYRTCPSSLSKFLASTVSEIASRLENHISKSNDSITVLVKHTIEGELFWFGGGAIKINETLPRANAMSHVSTNLRVEEVSRDSIFRMASHTKIYTNFLVLLMAKEGQGFREKHQLSHGFDSTGLPDPEALLDLDASLLSKNLNLSREYEQAMSNITLAMLMSHTSGLDRVLLKPEKLDALESPLLKRSGPHFEKMLAVVMQGSKFVAKPGERYSYSNINYHLLSLLLTISCSKATPKTSDCSFPTLLQRHILTPLNLSSHTFLPPVPPAVTPHLVIPRCQHSTNSAPIDSARLACESLYSTPRDTASFLLALLHLTSGSLSLLYRLFDGLNHRYLDLEPLPPGILAPSAPIGLRQNTNPPQRQNALAKLQGGGIVPGHHVYTALIPELQLAVVVILALGSEEEDLKEVAKITNVRSVGYMVETIIGTRLAEGMGVVREDY